MAIEALENVLNGIVRLQGHVLLDRQLLSRRFDDHAQTSAAAIPAPAPLGSR